MKFKLIIILQIVTLLGGCKQTQTVKNDFSVNTEILRNELSTLNLQSPGLDLQRNISVKDYRFIGICGIGCFPVGVSENELNFVKKYGLRSLRGTTDCIESDKHAELIMQATEYAKEYNQLLLQNIKSIED